MTYQPDEKISLENGYTFFVASKDGKGQPWKKLNDRIEVLGDAIHLARETNNFETAVFVVRSGSGYLYWSNRHPEVFNSTVITMEIY